MKLYQLVTIFSAATLLFLGCSSKEKERMEAEEKARREEAAGNKAITDMNRRIFGKKELPAAPASSSAPAAPAPPASKSDDKSTGNSSAKP